MKIERTKAVPPKRDKYAEVFEEAIGAHGTEEPVIAMPVEGSAPDVAAYMRRHDRAEDFTITSRGDTVYVEYTPS